MFVTKVRHAQVAGAQAAIIVDDRPENYLPYMADDGTGNDITIPSMLIYQNDGDRIKEALSSSNTATVALKMSWSIPVDADGIVDWKLWTSAYEPGTDVFKGVFGKKP